MAALVFSTIPGPILRLAASRRTCVRNSAATSGGAPNGGTRCCAQKAAHCRSSGSYALHVPAARLRRLSRTMHSARAARSGLSGTRGRIVSRTSVSSAGSARGVAASGLQIGDGDNPFAWSAKIEK